MWYLYVQQLEQHYFVDRFKQHFPVYLLYCRIPKVLHQEMRVSEQNSYAVLLISQCFVN